MDVFLIVLVCWVLGGYLERKGIMKSVVVLNVVSVKNKVWVLYIGISWGKVKILRFLSVNWMKSSILNVWLGEVVFEIIVNVIFIKVLLINLCFSLIMRRVLGDWINMDVRLIIMRVIRKVMDIGC